MERRTFLAVTGAVLLATPLAAEAQQAAKKYRVGIVLEGAGGLLTAPLTAQAQQPGKVSRLG